MALSFTLGIEQVQNELIEMQPPGCYWLTVNRPDDARLLARQVIGAQQALTLISAGEKPQSLLEPALPNGPERIPFYSLPEKRRALLDLPEDLARTLSAKPRLILFFTNFSFIEKLSPVELIAWIKKINRTLAARDCCLLIITSGSGVNSLRQTLLSTFRQLNGLAHLEYQQDSWNYRVSWWCHDQRLMADRALRLTARDAGFAAMRENDQNTPLTLNDEAICIAERQVLEGAPPLSSHWQLFDSNDMVASRAQQADSATVIFSLNHNEEIRILSQHIHTLRRMRGAGLKIMVREMQTSLRYSDERLLLACGVNAIVPFGAPMSRFLTTLESLQGQRYNRHVPANLDALLQSLQPLQQRGFLSLDTFCQSVTQLVSNTLLPENGKGLLVALRPVPELRPEQALTLCKPRRYGDLVTVRGDRLYLFLSSCRYNDLDTALKFIFRLPHDELFSNRLVWFEDLQILSEVRQMKTLVPEAWKDMPPATKVALPEVTPPQPVERQTPQPVVLSFNRSGVVRE
ncbi:cellulose biosynthesis protein BcsE [Pantoea sp. FN0302]|uniref:cellulose biosynthesis protein BcsE n=1 Tax=Pantoea sp. FN0302 TaxID=3418558 RepID=UPI003CEE10F5